VISASTCGTMAAPVRALDQPGADEFGGRPGYLGWKQAPPGGAAMKELEQFLLDRAMEHDSPALLFSLAAEYLISAKVIRPGVVTLMEMVGAARAGAGGLTFEQVAHLLDLSVLPTERRRFLATVGRRSTVQALERREERRYPILLALVTQSAVDQLDEGIAPLSTGGGGPARKGPAPHRR
jgi:Domain of unknown function (DUF4158)